MDISKQIKLVLETKDPIKIKEFLQENNLIIKNGKIYHKDQNYAEGQVIFWNQRQQARKILLNSLYGSILNERCAYNDIRVGQSVTLTGRSIARHMNAKVNEIIAGDYDEKGIAVTYTD